MYMYKIYPAKIASSSFVVQSCFQIKIIGPLRSQKSLCNGRSRRSERRQGRRPSWPSTSNAYPDRFAGGRSRPEGSEGVRDASQVWPGTRKTSQAAAAAPSPRKAFQQVAEVCIDLRATASNQNHASERSLYPYGDLSDWCF